MSASKKNFYSPYPTGSILNALTEPLSVAEHCIGNRTSIGPDDKVIVSGPGIIGLLCAISARSRGAEVILSGTEQDEATRLTAARTIGFETLVVGPGHPPLHEQITAYFPDGADALVEASGSAHALADAWQSVHANGTVTAVALYSRTIDFDLTQFLRKQIDLRTKCYASSKDDYLRAFKLLQDGAVDASVLTRAIPSPMRSRDLSTAKISKPPRCCSTVPDFLSREEGSGMDYPDPMGIGISDIDRPILIHKYPVQPVHPALFRILPLRTISLLAIPGNQFEVSGFQVNHTYGVTLGIRQINIPFRTHRYPLRS